MNLPNKLTVLRVVLVPLFLFFLLWEAPGECGVLLSRFLAAFLFSLAATTDFLDGKIARKYHLVTDFGKFMDPLADKFMVFSAIIGFISSDMYASNRAYRTGMIICGTVVIFRELAITSLRLVVAGGKEKIVIAASFLGKSKTLSQCLWILITVLEPALFLEGGLFALYQAPVISWIFMLIMAFLTVFSGFDYARQYWKYLDSNH